MDIIAFNEGATANGRIEKFNANPDSNSGIVTVPKTIASGETVTVPAGRVAVLPNVVVDGDLVVEAGGEIFVPAGGSIDYTNGIKVNGESLVMSIPTAYHIYNGSVEATNTEITNGFSTTLYTGNGATQDVITGVDMATQWGDDVSETFGGLVWCKQRSGTVFNLLVDTVRGANNLIYTNVTTAQEFVGGTVTGFDTSGFSIGNQTSVNVAINTNLATYASWNFQTTHRRTGVTNHGKAYTEHYNPFTGFTIIKYEGSGIAGHEIPHSLGRKLGFATIKGLSGGDAAGVTDWWSYTHTHPSNLLKLNLVNSLESDTKLIQFKTTEDIFSLGAGNGNGTNQTNNGICILYGWANSYLDETNKLIGNYEVGVYQGTGIAGNKVKTRGKPAWIMFKRLDSTGLWHIVDNTRNVSDPRNSQLYPNLSNVEYTGIAYNMKFNIDGFTLDGTDIDMNASGGQYLYMVVYDNDSGSGKSKYPKATDTTNLSINALVPYANGIDINGSKVSIEYKNETITGLTLTEGKNYLYSKNDGTYSVSKYEPMYGKLRDRVIAGENPDYFDLKTMKWYGTSGVEELVTNGTFDTDTSGWIAENATLSIVSGRLKVTNTGGFLGRAYQPITLEIGKEYTISGLADTVGTSWEGNINLTTSISVDPRGENLVVSAIANINTGIISFTASQEQYYLYVTVGSVSATHYGYFDNISVFEVEPTIGAEITPRTYLDCVVHADQNGQVTYVEELPKTTYITDLKVTDGFDLGQTWQNVTASRSAGITYTNTTGKLIFVQISTNAGGGNNGTVYINGNLILGITEGGDSNQTFSFVVPNGSTYVVTMASISLWLELR